MAFRRRLGVRFFVLLLFGLVVVLLVLQMLALSRISSPPPFKLPWELEVDEQRLQRDSEHRKSTPKATDKLSPHVRTKLAVRSSASSWSLPNSLKTLSLSPPTPLANKKQSLVAPKSLQSFTPHPLPLEAEQNCDKVLEGKKDALSAISRAKSQECKTFIRNVTCLQHAGLLYDRDITNQCPMGSFKGHEFKYLPYSLGTGPPIRIVFLLSIHGRAVRQVKRLLKAVYHVDHYFYVHVDSRSDYLHRKLYEDLSDLPNVYFPTWRMATIWGGASLLQMLLRAMEDLEFVLTDWQWDYFINLSESDYPLMSNDDLTQFLRVHRGKNFVKTHGGDIKKFIQKQGLDRTFVECDSHMWRVDTRPLPPDLTVDGGSDWIVLHRDYSRYLVTDKSRYLTELKKYYEFSLLPAESFFHTVIRNGPMCETFVKTNLRVTNWNRKLGCRCQYKHIVDWCGCSPNDFLVKDMSKLKKPSDHHFFARKFEAIVSQEVILQLDTHLFGPLPPDTPSLRSHWESIYHIEDDITKPSNARFSTYQSFLRQSLKLLYNEQADKSGGGECGIPKQAVVKEVHVWRESDQFKGLVVTLKDAMSDRFSPPEFEVLFGRVPHFEKTEESVDVGRRIVSLEIGSEWDGKESIFRNYAGILGAWDEPVAALKLTAGKQGTVHIIWDDPVGERIANFPMKLEAAWFVSFHKPKVELPIRPGIWTVRLELEDGTLLMKIQFLVVPITHQNKEVLELPQTVNAKRTYTVKPSMDAKEFSRWKHNVSKSGTELEDWMDQLVKEYWTIDGYCRMDVSHIGGEQCLWVQDCLTTKWSTFSPDPKTEIGEVRTNGRIR